MLKYEITGLDTLRQKFDPQLVDSAFDRALQAAAMKGRTRVSRKTRETYNVKARDVSRSVALKKLPSERGRLLLYAGHMLGLNKFSPRPRNVKTARGRRVGVTVQVRKGGGRKLVKGGFIAGMRKFVFARVGPNQRPIESKFSIGIAHMVGNPAVAAAFEAHVGEDAAAEFSRSLEFLMTSKR